MPKPNAKRARMAGAELGLALPLVGAPMAGGPGTPALAAAISRSGGLGFLGAGYRTAAQMAADIAELRGATANFGVNLFVPREAAIDVDAVQRYRELLRPEADHYAVELPPLRLHDDDDWDDKLQQLRSDPVPFVSFTFGLPPVAVVRALRAAGTRVAITVTDPAEARAALALGIDALVAQGHEAGGHSGTFDPAAWRGGHATVALVRAIAAMTRTPVIAAGGIADAGATRDALAAGAVAVQAGTAFLCADEAGTRAAQRAALSDVRFADTVMTRAFTGRPARGLRNRFTERYSAAAPVAYPAIHHLTRPIRKAAALRGDAQALNLWAGTGHRASRAAPAADIVAMLLQGV